MRWISLKSLNLDLRYRRNGDRHEFVVAGLAAGGIASIIESGQKPLLVQKGQVGEFVAAANPPRGVATILERGGFVLVDGLWLAPLNYDTADVLRHLPGAETVQVQPGEVELEPVNLPPPPVPAPPQDAAARLEQAIAALRAYREGLDPGNAYYGFTGLSPAIAADAQLGAEEAALAQLLSAAAAPPIADEAMASIARNAAASFNGRLLLMNPGYELRQLAAGAAAQGRVVVELEQDPVAAASTRKNKTTRRTGPLGLSGLPRSYFDASVSVIPRLRLMAHQEAGTPVRVTKAPTAAVPEGHVGMIPGLRYYEGEVIAAVDAVKPGGVAVVIAPTDFLDARSVRARERVHENAQLLGVCRLPAIPGATGDDGKGCDLLVFERRRGPVVPGEARPSWLDTTRVEVPGSSSSERMTVNQVYADAQLLLGQATVWRDPVLGTPRLAVQQDPQRPVGDAVAEALATAQGRRSAQVHAELPVETAVADWMNGPGALSQNGGVPVRVVDLTESGGPIYAPLGLRGASLERARGLALVRETLRDLVLAERAGNGDPRRSEAARAQLNEIYDVFVLRFGALNDPRNYALYRSDPLAPALASLEELDELSGASTKGQWFKEPMLQPEEPQLEGATAAEALGRCLATVGRVDPAMLSAYCGRPAERVVAELLAAGQVFEDPTSGELETASRYLSGNVREKLQNARAAAELEPRFKSNMAALEQAQPERLTLGDIRLSLGAVWIPDEVVERFARSLFGNTFREITVNRSVDSGAWVVDLPGNLRDHPMLTTAYGTPRRPAHKLLESLLNQQEIQVEDTVVTPEGDTLREHNEPATLLAIEKAELLNSRFRQYIAENEALAERLCSIYNERFNSYTPPRYDGSFLTLPGLSKKADVWPVHKDAVWRILQEGRAHLAQEAGVGKTTELILAAKEGKRLGLTRRVLFTELDSAVPQVMRRIGELYPLARVLPVSLSDLRGEGVKLLRAKLARSDWDIVLVPHSVLPLLQTDAKVALAERRNELKAIEARLAEYVNTDRRTRRRQALHKLDAQVQRLTREIERLEGVVALQAKELPVTLDELNVDAVWVDESHYARNLDTPLHNLSIDLARGSRWAAHLFGVREWLIAKRGDYRGMVFASATALVSHLVELYNVQLFLQPDVLREAGIERLAAWSSTFLKPVSRWEPAIVGGGYRRRTRYELKNAPDLARMLRLVMHAFTGEQLGIKRPDLVTHNVLSPMSDTQREMMKELHDRVTNIGKGGVDPREDNLLKVVTDGRKVALDPRLYDPSIDDELTLKIHDVVHNLVEEFGRTATERGVQLVFCDIGTPNHAFNLHGTLRRELLDRGVPPEEVALAHDAQTEGAREALFAAARGGRVRVLIGTTGRMGEAVDIQNRVAAVHHMDGPWNPCDIDQRDGRGRRPANRMGEVRRYIYTTEGSFDAFVWSTMEAKARAFAGLIRGDVVARDLALELDPTYEETAAITSGNPLVREKLETEREISRLENQERAHLDSVSSSVRQLKERQRLLEGVTKERAVLSSVPSITGAPPQWRANLSRYGIDHTIGGTAQTVNKVVDDLLHTNPRLKKIQGVSFGGVEVEVHVDPDTGKPSFEVAGLPAVRQPRMLERLLLGKDDRLTELEMEIASLQGEVDALQKASSSVFNDGTVLAELRARDVQLADQIAGRANTDQITLKL